MLTDFDSGVSPSHDDWIITVVFYSAVHFVDCFIVERDLDKPRSHVQRDRMIESNSLLSHLAFEYFSLKDLSQSARYQPLMPFSRYTVQQAFDQLDTVRQTLADELGNP